MSIEKWKLIDSEYIYQDNWFNARKDRCQKSDGSEVYPYYVLEYTDWTCAVGITKNNEIILVKQYRHALGEICLELPGGCVDASDKSLEETIQREFLEETGYAFELTEYLGFTSANPSTNANKMHMFLLQGGEKVKEQQLDKNEEIEVILVSKSELKEIIQQQKIVQSMHITTILYALQKLDLIEIKL